MTDDRHDQDHIDTTSGQESGGGTDEEPRDTRAGGYPAMPPLADADPRVRGEDEPVDSGWAGAAEAAEGEVSEER